MRDWRKTRSANAYRNVHCITPRETNSDDREAEHLARAVADLNDELAVLP
jgi:hypothetical protein